ncbi:hypothetical protein M885DRAFT_450568, partial [Pelagophyceae sp. CCMP2097]
MCAKADDPLTVNQGHRAIRVSLAAQDASALSGTVRFTFLGYTTSHDAARITSGECAAAWEALANVEAVLCDSSAGAFGGAEYNISFIKWPLAPAENNFFSHTGNPPIGSWTCDVTSVSTETGAAVECNITDAVSADVSEYEYCGRRGQCDFTNGQCFCLDDFEGASCTEPAFYISASNAEPGAHVIAAGNDYTGTVLLLASDKAAASDFNFLKFSADDEVQFTVRGDGHLSLSKLEVTLGATINTGGLEIVEGGLTVTDGGAAFADTATDASTIVVRQKVDDFMSTVLEMTTVTAETSLFYFITAGTAYDPVADAVDSTVFSVRGDGATLIKGTLTVLNKTVTNGLEVGSPGLTVTAGGAHIYTDGLHVYEDGAIIESDNVTTLLVSHRDTMDNGTVLSAETTAAYTAGISLIEAVMDSGDERIAVFGVSALPRTFVYRGGLEVVGGIDVTSGGLNVSAGGVSINGGGLRV